MGLKDIIILANRIKHKVLSEFLRFYYLNIKHFLNKKKNVMCPFCGWQGEKFLLFGIGRWVQKSDRCPKCDSLQRHRLFYLYLKKILDKEKPLKVLHFAPEKILSKLFQSYGNIDYLSVDINPRKAMRKEDITNLSFGDDSFDIVICLHVLEHIKDDIKAMREMHRVLKPSGFAVLQVPLSDNDKTFEDFSVTNPAEKERVFGHFDHVRIYGLDYKNRLKKAGFKVRLDKFAESLDKRDVRKFVLMPQNGSHLKTEGHIYYCKK